ncbi:MAG: ABC transporter permease [Bacteroidetes bacterium]|nr:ABC transporter permease [Bacteroidota bacterium]
MLTMIIGGLSLGFILVPLALGVHISYRLLRFTDISVDGTYALGGVVAAQLIIMGLEPVTATVLAAIAGAMAGACTGLLITRFGIQRILAGILIMTALYSLNFYVLGKSAHLYDAEITMLTYAESGAIAVFGDTGAHFLFGMKFFPRSVMSLLYYGAMALLLGGALLLFFRTRIGLAVRGAGSNEAAMRALGADVPLLLVVALAISNGLAALSGALLSQELAMVSITDGVGMIVTGLACVMLGDAFFGRKTFVWRFAGALIGALIYRVLIAMLSFISIFSSDVRLVTAIFVTLALVFPRLLKKLRTPAIAVTHPE